MNRAIGATGQRGRRALGVAMTMAIVACAAACSPARQCPQVCDKVRTWASPEIDKLLGNHKSECVKRCTASADGDFNGCVIESATQDDLFACLEKLPHQPRPGRPTSGECSALLTRLEGMFSERMRAEMPNAVSQFMLLSKVECARWMTKAEWECRNKAEGLRDIAACGRAEQAARAK